MALDRAEQPAAKAKFVAGSDLLHAEVDGRLFIALFPRNFLRLFGHREPSRDRINANAHGRDVDLLKGRELTVTFARVRYSASSGCLSVVSLKARPRRIAASSSFSIAAATFSICSPSVASIAPGSLIEPVRTAPSTRKASTRVGSPFFNCVNRRSVGST